MDWKKTKKEGSHSVALCEPPFRVATTPPLPFGVRKAVEGAKEPKSTGEELLLRSSGIIAPNRISAYCCVPNPPFIPAVLVIPRSSRRHPPCRLDDVGESAHTALCPAECPQALRSSTHHDRRWGGSAFPCVQDQREERQVLFAAPRGHSKAVIPQKGTGYGPDSD